jgi:ABC-type lipoprotein export system ATPase subunit
MEIKDLSWNENLIKRKNLELLSRSIRGLIIGKSGCGKTTLLLNLLLKPNWLEYDHLYAQNLREVNTELD